MPVPFLGCDVAGYVPIFEEKGQTGGAGDGAKKGPSFLGTALELSQ
ncbi:hypothetical protein [Desulfobaculum bizertense]|nr:hypothetical protein [Desulfobaculum bizertense]UIJ37590.1 hypothetical protein LWC08_12925 [Desulfobaculum bizertense]